MGDLVVPLLVVGLLVFGVVDVITSDAAAVRNLPKLAWLLLVVLLMPLGTIAWLFLGRPRATWEAAPERRVGHRPKPRSRRAVEEDPDDLIARIEARDRLLRQWAEEDRAKGRAAGDAGTSGGAGGERPTAEDEGGRSGA